MRRPDLPERSPDDLEMEAMAARFHRFEPTIGRIFGGGAILVLAPLWLFAIVAIGLKASSVALALLIVAIAFVTLPRSPRRPQFIVAIACALCTLFFIASRLLAHAKPEFQFVEQGRRDVSPPIASRIIDEGETVQAGLVATSAMRLIGGPEKDHLGRLLRDAYSTPAWPNAVLIDSSADVPRHFEHIPANSTSVPCLVFLHGFGGQLTAYLRVLHHAFGDRYAIVAPFLDSGGAFWKPKGKAVVKAIVTKYLPAEVDKTRVYLIGLSNGAIGATAMMQDPESAPLFKGFILVSGRGEVTAPLPRAKALLISGAHDPRFPLDYVKEGAEKMRAAGAEVTFEVLPADHFLWLSHADPMTAAVEAWLSK